MHVLDNVIQHSNINSAFKKSQYEDITDLLQLNNLTTESPVDLFKRGIKLDFNAYSTLKDEKNNDQWHCTFTNMA
jgi:hypothetical protein